MLRRYLISSLLFAGLPSLGLADSITRDLQGKLELSDCRPGSTEIEVSGKLDGRAFDSQSVNLDEASCARVQAMRELYPDCDARGVAVVSLRETVNRGYIFNSTSYELVRLENESPNVHQQSKAEYCAPKPKNVRRVANNFYAGGRIKPIDFAYLSSQGIQTVIDLQGGNFSRNTAIQKVIAAIEPGETPDAIATERLLATSAKMDFQTIPMTSLTMSASNVEALNQVLSRLANATAPIYVHCENGIDRTGLIEAIYRVRVLGESVVSARANWVAQRSTHAGSLVSGGLVDWFDTHATN